MNFASSFVYKGSRLFRTLLILISVIPLNLQATIIDTGDVVDTGAELLIGNTAFGKRIIYEETVNKTNIRLGNTAGVSGELEISGFESPTSLTTTGLFEVGSVGDGQLNIHSIVSAIIPQMIIGNAVGATGYVGIGLSAELQSLGVNSFVVVGDEGDGSMLLGDRDSITFIDIENLVLGEQSTGSGFVEVDGAVLDVGTDTAAGTLVIGDAGNGEFRTSSRSNIQIKGDGARVVIGQSTGGTGLLNLVMGPVTIFGSNGLYIFGDAGTGNMNCMSGSSAGFATSATGGQTIVGRTPGGQGTLSVDTDCQYSAGDILRIGLDENDNSGGIGVVTHRSGFGSSLSVNQAIRIGPQGSFRFDPINGAVLDFNGLTMFNSGNFNVTSDNFFQVSDLLEYTQTASGTLDMAATIPSFFGDPGFVSGLISADVLDLDGTINIDFTAIATPEAGQVFLVALGTTGVSISPSLVINTTGLPPTLTASPVIEPNGLSVVIEVPGPEEADMAVVSQVASPASATVGDQVLFSSSIVNNGPDTATAIVITDQMPAGSAFVSASVTTPQGSFPCTPAGNVVTCNIAQLLQGEGAVLDLSVITGVVGTAVNQVDVSAAELDPDNLNNTSSLDVPVSALPTISGIVTTPGGQPVAGIAIQINDNFGFAATSITDANGFYSQEVTNGTYVVYGVQNSNYSVNCGFIFVTVGGADVTKDCVATPILRTISGTVTTPGGQPVTGIAIQINDNFGFAATAITDANGFYSQEVTNGTYVVYGVQNSNYSVNCGFIFVTVGGADVTKDCTATPILPTISGTVTTPGGQPVAGIAIQINDNFGFAATAITNANGFYSQEVTAGTYVVYGVRNSNYSVRCGFIFVSVGGADITKNCVARPR